MYKKIGILAIALVMMVVFSNISFAGNVPGPGDQFTIKKNTMFIAVVNKRIIKIQAFEDVKVDVIRIIINEDVGKGVLFNHRSFPHNCPHHGRELAPIQGFIEFDYFEKNPDAYTPGV